MNGFWVALGGGIGAVARYALSSWLLPYSVSSKFPWPTFAVNLLGCLMAGILIAVMNKYQWHSNGVRLFLLTGVLGGFTTFSAFGLETFELIKRGEPAMAVLYVVASVLAGVAALALAYRFSA
jgi:fluoride exporter